MLHFEPGAVSYPLNEVLIIAVKSGFELEFCMYILKKRDMCTRLFLLCQIQGFMCNYKSFNIKDLQDQKLF